MIKILALSALATCGFYLLAQGKLVYGVTILLLALVLAFRRKKL